MALNFAKLFAFGIDLIDDPPNVHIRPGSDVVVEDGDVTLTTGDLILTAGSLVGGGGVGSVAGQSFKLQVIDEAVADDGSVALADAVQGFLLLFCTPEGGLVWIGADGAPVILAGTANLVTTDTDAKLCVLDTGTGAAIKNALGSELAVKALFLHFTAPA